MSDHDFMGGATETYAQRLNQLQKNDGGLEPSGDEAHDRLTREALGLDALDPLRNSVIADANQEVYDDTIAEGTQSAFVDEE